MPNVASNDIEEIAIEVLGPGRPRVVDDREALGLESYRTRTGVSLTVKCQRDLRSLRSANGSGLQIEPLRSIRVHHVMGLPPRTVDRLAGRARRCRMTRSA